MNFASYSGKLNVLCLNISYLYVRRLYVNVHKCLVLTQLKTWCQHCLLFEKSQKIHVFGALARWIVVVCSDTSRRTSSIDRRRPERPRPFILACSAGYIYILIEGTRNFTVHPQYIPIFLLIMNFQSPCTG